MEASVDVVEAHATCCSLQAHPHGPLHPVPFPTPPEDCHWCVTMYAGQGQQDLHPTSKQKEFQHLQAVFQANGIPAELVRKMLSHTRPVLEDPAEPQKIMCLPYIRGLSERIERICTPLGAKAAFKPAKTLRQTLMNIKNCISEEKKRELVYEVPCKEWHLSRRW